MREHIRATPPFGQLRDENLAAVESAAEWKALRAGEQLFALGDQGDAMYIVVEGALQVLIPGTGGEDIVVAELGARDITGEIQLLTGGTRSATVRAVTPSRLIALGRQAFDRLTETTPGAVAELNTLILRRLRRSNSTTRCIARTCPSTG